MPRSVDFIFVKPFNAFDNYDNLLNECLKKKKDTLFIISLAMTAKILVYDLTKSGYRALD